MAKISRRDAVARLAAVGAGLTFPRGVRLTGASGIVVAGKPVEVVATPVGDNTVRITIFPLEQGRAAPVPVTGALTRESFSAVRTRWAEPPFRETRFQSITVRLSDAPPTIEVL